MSMVNVKAEIFILVVHQEIDLDQFLGNDKLCEGCNTVLLGYPIESRQTTLMCRDTNNTNS